MLQEYKNNTYKAILSLHSLHLLILASSAATAMSRAALFVEEPIEKDDADEEVDEEMRRGSTSSEGSLGVLGSARFNGK